MRRIFAVGLILLFLVPAAGASGLDELFRLSAEEEFDSRFPAGEEGGAFGESHSKRKAFFLSALLPGLGQRYNESSVRSAFFFTAEAVIWTSFIVFKAQEHLRTDDFEEYADAYAGVDGGGKETEFYRILTIYDNSDDYNTSVRIEARAIYPGDLEAQERFYQEYVFGEGDSFRWRTNQDRLEYRLIRNDALNSGRRADYAVVAAVLNRAISAVEAARVAGRWKPAASVAERLRVSVSDPEDPAMLRIGIGARF